MHFLSIASIRSFTREDLKRIRSRERKTESERFAGIYSISIRVITTSLTLANGLVVSAYLTAERTKGLSCRGGWHMGTMAHAITMATSPTTDLSAISLLSSSLSLFVFPFLSASLSPSFSRREVHDGCPFVCRSPPSRARTYVILLFLPQALYIRLSFRPVRPIDGECIHRTLAHWELVGSYDNVSVHDETYPACHVKICRRYILCMIKRFLSPRGN